MYKKLFTSSDINLVQKNLQFFYYNFFYSNLEYKKNNHTNNKAKTNHVKYFLPIITNMYGLIAITVFFCALFVLAAIKFSNSNTRETNSH